MASADVEFRCFVGGFHYRTDEKDLERAFSKFGDIIDSKIIRNPVTGRSRNFGFITFKEEKSMRVAIEEMNGRKLDGSIVDPKDIKFECFVGNLPDDTTEKDLERFLSVFGKVIDSEIVYDPETRRSRRFGYVTFKDEKSMWSAIKRVEDILDDNDEEPHATSITNGDESDFCYTSVKKSNRSDYRVITVKEAWPRKPSYAERGRLFMELLRKKHINRSHLHISSMYN